MLQIKSEGDVVQIGMDRPPANALDTALVDSLIDAFDLAVREGARALVVTGRPGMFSGGLDVPALIDRARPEVLNFWTQFFALMGRLASSPVPVVAALSGHAPAGGAVLALHCDYRIGVDGPFKMGLNEVRVGLPVPRTILVALELAVGSRVARRLAVRGELIAMQEAAAVGLVDELVQADQLFQVARERAEALMALPPIAMNTTRLATKARLIDALEQGAADDAAAATDWWFSAETQAEMRKLVERLASKPSADRR